MGYMEYDERRRPYETAYFGPRAFKPIPKPYKGPQFFDDRQRKFLIERSRRKSNLRLYNQYDFSDVETKEWWRVFVSIEDDEFNHALVHRTDGSVWKYKGRWVLLKKSRPQKEPEPETED